ncbi:MAG: hypothetical protein R2796_01090 [Chitinophagaceae bacterium]|nr:hypothetical protein [Chitinophagaceae bacterium]MCB0741358.1 hypothetical protein [Chitinophagaceae bacterium]HQU56510.1 hypothetical protein [Chitinophagaceae bacterium]HQV05208.1 hypothetical protein [Chitinophagaceae bacterium]
MMTTLIYVAVGILFALCIFLSIYVYRVYKKDRQNMEKYKHLLDEDERKKFKL